jgi:ABC-type dipeptide/oligopeptide/nickel transport system permease component
MIMIYILCLFFGSQILLMKSSLGTKCNQVKFRYILMLVISLILVSIVFGTVGVLTTTILCSSTILYRFQQKYAEMEQGKI